MVADRRSALRFVPVAVLGCPSGGLLRRQADLKKPHLGVRSGDVVIRHFTASAIIIADDHVLLLNSAKGMGWIYHPGGHVEPGEDLAQAAIREVREEVGLEIELITERRACL
jgi:8-oxo-dGTP pyrophosphatase MutT (NUDIX family)